MRSEVCHVTTPATAAPSSDVFVYRQLLVLMHSPSSISETSRPFLTWQRILDWAQEHYRCRTFSKDERIPARPGLLYLVQRGAVRLVGTGDWIGIT